jgi:site-specific DNA recombinase
MHKLTALYSRSATDDKQAIENQKAKLEEYCKENSIKIFKHYSDNNQSSNSLNRPALNELMQDLEAGKIDKIIVTDISRLSRAMLNVARIISLHIEASGAKLITLDYGEYRLDDYNPEGGFFGELAKQITNRKTEDKI